MAKRPKLLDGEWIDDSDHRISMSMGMQARMVNACQKSADFHHARGETQTAAMYELWRWMPFGLVEIVMTILYPPPGGGGTSKKSPRPRVPETGAV